MKVWDTVYQWANEIRAGYRADPAILWLIALFIFVCIILLLLKDE